MVIFRDDDVSPNTDIDNCEEVYSFLKKEFFHTEIIAGVSLFAKDADGSVYPGPPFKDNKIAFFYDVDKVVSNLRRLYWKCPYIKIASHGLLHVDHSKLHRQAQEMSILTSCHFLKTKLFIPPFNRFNKDTEAICRENGIEIFGKGWKSLEHENFDLEHKKWYFHSWRMNVDQMRKAILHETCGASA